MPKGRVLENDRERERKDDDGKIVRTVTKATVVRSENDFFSLVDRGGSIEVIAEMWGLGRHCLMDAVKGRTHCKRESCEIPNRYPEYVERLERAKASGVDDPLFDPYRKMIRARQMKERLQCKVKSMETRVRILRKNRVFTMEKGGVMMCGKYGSLISTQGGLVSIVPAPEIPDDVMRELISEGKTIFDSRRQTIGRCCCFRIQERMASCTSVRPVVEDRRMMFRHEFWMLSDDEMEKLFGEDVPEEVLSKRKEASEVRRLARKVGKFEKLKELVPVMMGYADSLDGGCSR